MPSNANNSEGEDVIGYGNWSLETSDQESLPSQAIGAYYRVIVIVKLHETTDRARSMFC